MEFGGPDGDDADAVAVNFDMDHEQQAGQPVEADDRITRLVVARSIHQHQQRVLEYGGRVFKTDAADTPCSGRLVGIPDEVIATNVVPYV